MKKNRTKYKLTAVLLSMLIIIGMFTACSESDSKVGMLNESSTTAGTVEIDIDSGPATILPKLQKAYNSQDLYAIVECFDPSITDTFWGVAELFGLKADAIAQILPFFSQVLGGSGILDNSAWGTVELTVVDYEIDNDIGEITYNVSLSYTDGTNRTFDETVDVVLVDGTWYIAATQSMDISGMVGGGIVVPDPIPVVEGITEADVANGLFEIHSSKKYGFINNSGKVIIEPFFAGIGTFTEGYCPVLYEEGNFSKWGFIDQMGNLVVDYTFDDISNSSVDGYWAVKHNGKWGFYNVQTNKSVEFQYDDCTYSAEDYWAVCIDKKWGFINPTTGANIPCQYSECGTFNAEASAVKKGDYWGAVDKDNNKAVNFIYDEMTAFEDGFSVVEINDGMGVIRSDGSYVVPLMELDSIEKKGDFFVLNNWDWDVNFKIYNIEGTYLGEYENCLGLWGAKLFLWDSQPFGDTNITAIDRNGTVQIDILRDYFPFLENAEAGKTIDMYVGSDSTSDIWGISVSVTYGQRIGKTQVGSNYITGKGEFLFNDWTAVPDYEICYGKKNYRGFYLKDTEKTLMYNTDWELIAELDGEWTHGAVEYRTVWDNYDNNCYYVISTGDIIEYKDIDDNPDNDALIVYDDFFCGLYYNGELLGAGVTYNEITYDSGLEVFTLKLVAETQRIRIGRDGTVNNL